MKHIQIWSVLSFLCFILFIGGGIVMLVIASDVHPTTEDRPRQVFEIAMCTAFNEWVSSISDGDSEWYGIKYNASFLYNAELTVWGWLGNDTERFGTETEARGVSLSRPMPEPLTCYYDPEQIDFESTKNSLWMENPSEGTRSGLNTNDMMIGLTVAGSICVAIATAAAVFLTVVFVRFLRRQLRSPFSNHRACSDGPSKTEEVFVTRTTYTQEQPNEVNAHTSFTPEKSKAFTSETSFTPE